MAVGKKITNKQIDKFKSIANQLGCDESEAAFDSKLKRITKAKSKPDAKKGKRA